MLGKLEKKNRLFDLSFDIQLDLFDKTVQQFYFPHVKFGFKKDIDFNERVHTFLIENPLSTLMYLLNC